MSDVTKEDVVQALGNLTVMELIALTKKLEGQWGVKAVPPTVTAVQSPTTTNNVVEQTEFTVTLVSYPADKKMTLIKLVKEVMLLGLKESKDLVESVPKTIKDSVSKAEAEELKHRFVEAGGVVEVK